MFSAEPTLKPVSSTKRSRTDWKYFPSQPAFSSLSILSRAIKKKNDCGSRDRRETSAWLLTERNIFPFSRISQRFQRFVIVFESKTFILALLFRLLDLSCVLLVQFQGWRGGMGGLVYRREKPWEIVASGEWIKQTRLSFIVDVSFCRLKPVLAWFSRDMGQLISCSKKQMALAGSRSFKWLVGKLLVVK